MKKYVFKTEKDILENLYGKVYAIMQQKGVAYM